MRRKRTRRVERKTAEEKAFTAWLHRQPCSGLGRIDGHVCEGELQQAHIRNLHGPTGLGLKPNDLESIPACRSLHDWLDGRTSPRGWSYEARQALAVAILGTLLCEYALEENKKAQTMAESALRLVRDE